METYERVAYTGLKHIKHIEDGRLKHVHGTEKDLTDSVIDYYMCCLTDVSTPEVKTCTMQLDIAELERKGFYRRINKYLTK